MSMGQAPMMNPPQYSTSGMNTSVPAAHQQAFQQLYNKRYALTYRRTASIWIGSILITCGAVSIMAGAIAIDVKNTYSEIGAGIWVGVMFITAGGIAIAAACDPIAKLVYAATVLAFVSLGMSIFQMFLASEALQSHTAANGLMIASAILAGILSLSLGIINSKLIANNAFYFIDTANQFGMQNQVVRIPVQGAQTPTGQYHGQPVYYTNPNQPNQQP